MPSRVYVSVYMPQQYCYEPYVIQSSLSHQTVAYSPYFTTNATPLFSPPPFIVQVPSLPLSLTLSHSEPVPDY